MTTVQAATPTQVVPQTAVAPQAKEKSDYETFLQMLTVQMNNQDPLNPVDSADYAVQLATFSGVEQQVQTNDLMKELISKLSGTALSDLAGYIGRDVPATEAAAFNGTPLTLRPKIHAEAQKTIVEVRDASGKLLQEFNMPHDQQEIDWAGVAVDGSPLPHGAYSFQTVGLVDGAEVSRTDTEVFQRVTEVRLAKDGTPELVLASGGTTPASGITALR